MREKRKNDIGGPIGKIRVPDSDIDGWIRTLREGGFSVEEIDHILSMLNASYAKGAGIDPIEDELKRIEKYLNKSGRTLTDEQKRYIRMSIASRKEFEDFNKK